MNRISQSLHSIRPAFVLASTIAILIGAPAQAANISLTAGDAINFSSFDTGLNWQGGVAPSAGNQYFTGAFLLRTPVNPTSATFGGDLLSIDAGGSLSFKTSGVTTVNNLVLNGGSLQQGLTGATPEEAKLAGTVTINAASGIDTSTGSGRIFTVDAQVRGSAPLVIQGTGGTVNFNNLLNDYTGAITLGGATTGRSVALVVQGIANGGTASALGASSAAASSLTLDGGTLRVAGTGGSTDRLFTVTTFGGGIESSGTAAVTFGNTGAVILSGTGNRTLTLGGTNPASNIFAPSIGDNGGATSVTKAGAGTWVLTNTNTFTGTLNITGGILEFSSLANIGAATAPISVGAGTLRWAAGNNASLSGRAVSFTGAATLATGGQDVTISSNITGTGGFTKAGTGIITLSGSNTFLGNVSVGNSAGGIRITNSDSLGRGTKTISVVGNVGTANSPNLRLASGAGRLDLPASLSFTSSADGNNGAGSVPGFINESGRNSIGGNFTLTSGGGGTRFRVDAGSLALNGTMTPNATGRVVFFSGAALGAANGVLADGSTTNTLSITKDDAGTWALNGANTYTLATNVTAGTLRTTTASTGGGSYVVSNNANFGVRVATPGQTLTTLNLTLNSAATGLAFDLGTLGNPTAPVITAATFNPNGAVNVTVSGANLTATTFPLVKYTTLSGGGFAALNLVAPPRTTATLENNTANSTVDLKISAIDYPRWTGIGGNTWDTSTQNWREITSGNATAYIQGTAGGSDSVLFDNNAAVVTTSVNLASAVTPASVTVNNPTQDYTFSGTGKISGFTGLTKLGAGSLMIANTGINDYLGVTRISEGTLRIGDGTTAGAGSLGLGPVVNNASLVLDRPDDFSLANLISGSGAIVKNNVNTVVLGANNPAYTGAITVTGGTLRLGAANALGTVAGDTSVNSGGTLDLAGLNLGAEAIKISGAGVGGNGALVNSAADQTQALRFLTLTGNATIGGPGRYDLRTNGGGEKLDLAGFKLTKVGTNRFGIAGATVTDGSIDVNAGTLAIEGASVIQGTGTLTFASGTTAIISGTTGTNITRPMVWNGNTVDSASTTAAINSDVTLGGNVTVAAAAAANTLTLAGAISGNGFGLTKTGAGILELSGSSANTFTGTTTVSAGTLRLNKTGVTATAGDVVVNGGTLTLAAAGQLGADSSVTINQAGTVTTGNLLQTFKNLTINTTTLQTINNLVLSGKLSFTAGLHDLSSGQTNTVNALSISGAANYRLGANSATSTLNIGSGGLNLSAGTLQLGQVGGANITAQVNLGGDVTSSGTSAITNPNTLGPRLLDLQSGIRTFNVVDGVTTVSPTIQNGGLTKTGAGTLALTGASTYAGDTNVSAGTLLVNGSLSGSLVTVGTNAVLAGSGSINGDVTVNGTLQPGATLGTLAFGLTNLLLGPTATTVFELGDAFTYDRLASINQLTLGGTVKLTLASGYSPVQGDTFDLFDATAVVSNGFNLATNLQLPSLAPGLSWQTTNFVSDGVLTVIPEPASATLLMAGVTLLGGMSRLRRRRA